MRTYLFFLLAGVLLQGSGCTAAQPPASQPEYRTTATVKDIMQSMIDPSADFVWESVATTIDATGTHEKAPQTDEEWTEVRRRTLILLEATNLLQMPGRHIARPGEKSEFPEVELAPEVIETMVNEDRESWKKLAHGLHDASMAMLKAVDAKSTEGIMSAGEGLDQACERCHQKYWYPPDMGKGRK